MVQAASNASCLQAVQGHWQLLVAGSRAKCHAKLCAVMQDPERRKAFLNDQAASCSAMLSMSTYMGRHWTKEYPGAIQKADGLDCLGFIACHLAGQDL